MKREQKSDKGYADIIKCLSDGKPAPPKFKVKNKEYVIHSGLLYIRSIGCDVSQKKYQLVLPENLEERAIKLIH